MLDEEENTAVNEANENDENKEQPIEVEDEEKKVVTVVNSAVSKCTSKKLKQQESAMKQISKASRRKKAELQRCLDQESWDLKKKPLWHYYMKMYANEVRRNEEAEKDKYGDFYRKRPANNSPSQYNEFYFLPTPTGSICQRLNIFNAPTLKPCVKTDSSHSLITTMMKDDDNDCPAIYPCTKRDVIRERKILARKAKMEKLGVLPNEIDEIDSPESSDDDNQREMANLKELGYAVIPRTQPKKSELIMIDRACGERPSLVEGDYIVYELNSKMGPRKYANICLRGLKGMHLAELRRVRQRSWKFCMYQALVALLVKTQLRYKYAWSANIDYIYELAWTIFIHVGFINVTRNQRFDDVHVYNYKYSVELELVHELSSSVKVDPSVGFRYFEKELRKQSTIPRKELTLMVSTELFGTKRTEDCYRQPVHKSSRDIEKWFDTLDDRYTNCVYRTPRFSLAFWRDGSFWYLYNPYHCDKYGFWEHVGFACIVKFSSRTALKRHLIILTLRAYAYETEIQKNKNTDVEEENITNGNGKKEEEFKVQIFQLIYHSCQIHNIKLYNRKPKRAQLVESMEKNIYTTNPLLEQLVEDKACLQAISDGDDDDNDEMDDWREKSRWIRDSKITWSKVQDNSVDDCRKINNKITKWFSFDIIEPLRLYVLWGQVHISHEMFPRDNQNQQAEACYAVSMGVMHIVAPERWCSDVLDAIVVHGDSFYSQRKQKLQCQPNVQTNYAWDTLPFDQFCLDNIIFDVKAHPAVEGRLFSRDQPCLLLSMGRLFKDHRFVILSCLSACLGIFKHYCGYYALDVQSYGPPIYSRGERGSYLLRTANLEDMVRSLVLIIGTPEHTKFQLRPIEIVKIEEFNYSEEDESGKKQE